MYAHGNSSAQKYVESRAYRRQQAQSRFFEFNAGVGSLIGTTHELIADFLFYASDLHLSDIPNADDCADLMMSFCRSYFIASDLVMQGDLVEAIVIIRKQINLLGRLQAKGSSWGLESVINDKASIDHIKACLKPLYCDYSEHYATPTLIKLCGSTECASDSCLARCAHAVLQDLIMSAFLYYLWADRFLHDHLEDYEGTHEATLFEKAYQQHKKLYPDGPLSWRSL